MLPLWKEEPMSGRWKRLGPIPLRLMMAVGFLVHGLPKLTPAGHQSFTGVLTSLGVPSPIEVAWLVAGLEVIGALMLLIGYQVRLIVIPLIVEMFVAMFLVHWPKGFGPGGIETNLLYITILMSLLLSGAGAWSVGRQRMELASIPHEPALARRYPPPVIIKRP